jgi:hypothetical protein
MGILASERLLLSVSASYRTLILLVILVTAVFGQFRRNRPAPPGTIACRQHPACDGCPERRVALNLRHISASALAGRLVIGRQCPGWSRARDAPDQRLFVSARHKKKRNPFTHNRTLSRITVAMAGVTVVPAAVAVGLPASDTTAGSSSSLLARTEARTGATTAPTHLAAGLPLMDVARRDVARLEVNLARAQLAAEGAAARRAARRRAQRAARAAATPPPAPAAQISAGSAPQASGNPQKIAEGMLGSFGWPSSEFGCLVSLWNVESGWNIYAQNPSSGAYGIPQALPGSKMASAGPDWQGDAATQIRWGLGYIKSLYGSPCGAWSHEQATGWY